MRLRLRFSLSLAALATAVVWASFSLSLPLLLFFFFFFFSNWLRSIFSPTTFGPVSFWYWVSMIPIGASGVYSSLCLRAFSFFLGGATDWMSGFWYTVLFFWAAWLRSFSLSFFLSFSLPSLWSFLVDESEVGASSFLAGATAVGASVATGVTVSAGAGAGAATAGFSAALLPPSKSILPTGFRPAKWPLALITSCSCWRRFSWFSFSCSIRIASRSFRLSSTISLETARLLLSALNLFKRNWYASSEILVLGLASISIFLCFLSSSAAVLKEMFTSFKTLLILIVFPSLIYFF